MMYSSSSSSGLTRGSSYKKKMDCRIKSGNDDKGITLMICFIFVFLFSISQVSAQNFNAEQKKEIESILHNYLVTHPDVLKESFTALEKVEKERQVTAQKQAAEEHKDLLLNSKNHFVTGNPQGDVTLVEFFDYNCGYCRASQNDLKRLIREDTKLRVVLKEYPVLGSGSIDASLIASQLVRDPNYSKLHDALLASDSPLDKDRALAIAKRLGFNTAALEKNMQSENARTVIEESYKLANALQINGTPGYVIGTEVYVGAVGYEKLKAGINNMRKCGKVVC